MKGRTIAVTAVNLLLLSFFVFTSFQSPFSGESQPAKQNVRRALRGSQKDTFGAAEEEFVPGNTNAKSYFQPWIQQDFALWEEEGIKEVRPPACVLLASVIL